MPIAPPPPAIRSKPAAGKGGALLLTALGLALLLGGGFVTILIVNSNSSDDDDRKDDPSRLIAQGDRKEDGKDKDQKIPDDKPATPPKDGTPPKDSKPDAPPKSTDKPTTPPDEPTTPTIAAQLTQLTPETQKQVDAAVEKGVRYLRKMQSKDGNWNSARHGLIASAALPAMTLLECGVPANDPAVLKAAAYVRLHGPKETATYHLSLGILFLDRLGDPQDRRLIQKMALRLMAGQKPSGGWVYQCPKDLTDREEYALFQALEHNRPTSPLQLFDRDRDDRAMDFFIVPPEALDARVGPGSSTSQARDKPKDSSTTGSTGPATTPANRDKPTTPPPAPEIAERDYASMPLDLLPRQRLDLKDVPPRLKDLPVVRPLPAARELIGGDGTDNSNTQFGILGIWAAGRNGVPTERALALLAKRFRRSQANDGSWGYHFRTDGQPERQAAMTCAGLLGLAVGHGVVVSTGGQPKNIDQDPGLKKGLVALSKHVEGLPSIDRIRGKARPRFVGNVDYYYLWSLERVGVLFNLHEINGKEWYPWGVDIILERQTRDGNWTGPLSDAHADTCFALLFLKRTNLVRDLSRHFENIAEKPRKD